jgi:hypothetical protein
MESKGEGTVLTSRNGGEVWITTKRIASCVRAICQVDEQGEIVLHPSVRKDVADILELTPDAKYQTRFNLAIDAYIKPRGQAPRTKVAGTE